jgi:transcriptional regulator with XRE-family HTH domain
MSTLSVTLARSMRAERARRGWSQDELASYLGWSRATVSSIESGRRRLAVDDIPALCAVFNLGLADLLDGLDDDLRRALDV